MIDMKLIDSEGRDVHIGDTIRVENGDDVKDRGIAYDALLDAVLPVSAEGSLIVNNYKLIHLRTSLPRDRKGNKLTVGALVYDEYLDKTVEIVSLTFDPKKPCWTFTYNTGDHASMAYDGGCVVGIEAVDASKANELSVNKHKAEHLPVWSFLMSVEYEGKTK